MVKVLFVCLGNICRSPMADGVFAQMVAAAGLADEIAVDSAGTSGYHEGDLAHRGTRDVLRRHDIPYNGRSRQVTPADMDDASTWIVAMDDSNMRDLKNRFGDHPRLVKLLQFADNYPDVDDVPDPYYTGGFDYVYDLVRDGCVGLLAHIRAEENL